MGKIAKKIKKCFVISKQIINFAPTKDNMMARNNPKVAYLEEALSFIESISKSAGDKLLEIVHRVECGERNPVIFSKLEGTEIWEFRTLYNKVKYRLFAFWDTQTDMFMCMIGSILALLIFRKLHDKSMNKVLSWFEAKPEEKENESQEA